MVAGRKKMDPVSEAALDVVALDQQREEQAEQARADREKRIAEAHEIAGRIQALTMVGKLVTVTNLIQLRRVKESKVYRDLPNIGTWDKYCDYLELDRHTIDQHLLNLAAFGEDFLVTATNLQVSLRDLRKLRQLSHDGAVVIDAEAVIIGEERIPLTPDHKDDLQAAIESLIEQQAAMTAEVEAQKKAFDRVQADTRKSMIKLQKDLDKFTAEAEEKGFLPGEEQYLENLAKKRATFDGLVSFLTPDAAPVPVDATTRMAAAYLELLGYMRRTIEANHDTAVDLYSTSAADDDWVPPHLRPESAGTEG